MTMAYLSPNYDYDIFISFADRDNRLFREQRPELGGWVERFARNLEVWLRDQRRLDDFKVWLDRKRLSGASLFEDRIRNDLKRTGILLVLHSVNYRESDFCRSELGWFLEAARAQQIGLAPGRESRVLNVLINNIPKRAWTDGDHWTRDLAGTTGFHFHTVREDDPQAFCDPLFDTEPAYREAMKPIIDTAYNLLTRHLCQSVVATPAPTPQPAPEAVDDDQRPTIFVASCPETQLKLQKRLLREIEASVRIAALIPPPYGVAAHDRALEAAVRDASLSIHLLDDSPGELIDDAASHYPTRQAEAARRAGGSSLLCLPEALDLETVEDPAHRRWLRSLVTDSRDNAGYQLLRGSPTRLIHEIKDQIERIVSGSAVDASERTIVVDPHKLDQVQGLELGYRLQQRSGDLTLFLTRDGTEPAERWTDFEELVARANDLVVLCGRVAPAWVRRRVERAFQVAAGRIGETLALRNIWVLMLPNCPGGDAIPNLPPLLRVQVLDNTSGPNIADTTLDALLGGGAPL